MLTRAIPKAALPVVEIIRRDVPRPAVLPSTGFSNSNFRWRNEFYRCPMGLHPESHEVMPIEREDFAGGVCLTRSVKAFGDWWDALTDPQAAVDAVWGDVGGGLIG